MHLALWRVWPDGLPRQAQVGKQKNNGRSYYLLSAYYVPGVLLISSHGVFDSFIHLFIHIIQRERKASTYTKLCARLETRSKTGYKIDKVKARDLLTTLYEMRIW